MRYIPTNGQPDGNEVIDPRTRMFAGMFQAPRFQVGNQDPIMMDSPSVEPDAQTLYLPQRREQGDDTKQAGPATSSMPGRFDAIAAPEPMTGAMSSRNSVGDAAKHGNFFSNFLDRFGSGGKKLLSGA